MQQNSRAIARKPRDAVRFGLLFADIHKLKSSQAQKARLQSYTCTVFHKKLYPLLFHYIFSFTKTNFTKIPLSTQEVLVIMSIK